ncbi:MAG TPA: HAMP domain-containing sensor histidine kinase [Steroidobacteraceae bacterium]|jgi:signal transduction histidine kinase|nr:HAMP domain-containing sensor histidine kinase [Steroidobacteraceae bacterium]
MLRLYLRFYLALVVSLVLFGLATATLWHFTGASSEQAGVTLGRLIQNILPPATAPAAEQQEALRRLAEGLKGDVTLFDRNENPVASIGKPLPSPGAHRHTTVGMTHWEGAPISYVHLADGRWIEASVPMAYGHPRAVFHFTLLLLALSIGLAAYPLVRQISGRLERLQRGVESLGAGDFTARVAVEGRDEVARLATSFNRAAGQIEQLVQSHKSLLANTSHELRTPLARIRLAVELMKDSVDEKRKIGLEQDIAELDWLVGEILLASRLDAVTEVAREEVDLLALAAEECARYDETQLEGSATSVRGDPRLLRRLLRNLLENARRHGSPPTQVRIAHAAATATITVWDAGPGLPATEFDNVFRPFYRPANSRSPSGSGLGLALVRQIARHHGGDAICSTLADGPMAFVVTLPT